MITKIILLVCAAVAVVALCRIASELEGIHDKILLAAFMLTTADEDVKFEILTTWEEN